jgi:DNA-binding transcriptional MerR regulator
VATKKQRPDRKSRLGGNNYTMAIAVKLTGVESHRIRRYEEGGLLTPERTEGHQRLFSEADIELIIEIAKLEDEGINVDGIKAILAMRKGERE